MSKEKLKQFFQSSGFISSGVADNISQVFTSYTLPKNEYFLKEGKVSNEYLFLENGFMRAFAHDTEGNDITTGFYSPNQLVFEVSSFFTRTPSRENIQALTDCEGWVISFEQLNHLFHSLPEFREFGRNALVRGFAALKLRTLSTITETAEQRYLHLLEGKPEIFQNALKAHCIIPRNYRQLVKQDP